MKCIHITSFVTNNADFNIKYLCLCCFTVAPMVSIMGIAKNWYVGQANVKFTCDAKANPPARHFTWIRSVFAARRHHVMI